ncbi:protein PARALOG OF AIPP2 isoform X2 [Elaeis guineensis]|uniref:protein PARALOG OF AIPP2 isoform X2 n=1 Tax=Elaeis guineensis var. tenera TaxID=51953 RepID=UPI003C6CDA4B
MRKLADRPLKELYDRTERISAPEAFLQGSCRIQGPVDESDHEFQRMNVGFLQSEKSYMFIDDGLQMRAESGTCNVCFAPCSSCMHRNMSAMMSKVECGFSDSICERKETDSCSFIGVDELPPTKSRACDNQQHAASDTSNLISTSSSHDSYSENAESKATLRASALYDASEDVDMPPKVSLGDAAEEDQPLRKATGTSHRLNPSCCHSASDSHLGMFLHRDEEQRGLECHGDNLSCITGVRDANTPACYRNVDLDKKDTSCSSASTYDLLAKENEMEVQVDACHGSHHHEIEASESKSRELSTCPLESSWKKSSSGSSVNAAFSHKSDPVELPPTKKELSTKMLSSHPHSQSGCVDCSLDSKDLEGYLTSQHQEEPSECSMNDVKSSPGGPLVSTSIDGQKSAALPSYEDSKLSQIRGDSSSRALKNHDSCLETEAAMDGENPSDEATKCRNTCEQFGKNGSLLEASNVQGPDMQQHLITKVENSESDSGLDDVKVCDICGDAGVEELLATCSRCSDGAEHTYCMRIKLDKIPEGEWLCEECQLKEDAENKKTDKSDSVSGTSKVDILKEKSQNFGSNLNPKSVPKLDIEAIDTEVRGSTKGMQSPQKSAQRHADSPEVTSMNSRMIPEIGGGSIGISSPRKNAVMSRESSFKSLDFGKVKPTNLAPSFKGQTTNGSQAISRSHTSSSNASKVQAQLNSTRGPLSKQLSFDNSYMRPKVKQLINNSPRKQKIMREAVSSNGRKDVIVKTMTKSASFKCVSSGLSNTESLNKTQSLKSPRSDEPGGWKPVKERNMMERKNSFVLDHPSGASTAKMDLKISQHSGNLSNTSEQDILSIKKGLENPNDLGTNMSLEDFVTGRTEVKKQTSNSFKRYELCNPEDQRPFQVVPREGSCTNPIAIDRSHGDADSVLQRSMSLVRESFPREDKSRDSTHSSSSRQAASSGSRVFRCHKCNETGHATQFCPINKLRISALKPAADRSLRVSINKSNKWKDAIEAAKTKTQNRNKLSDQSECSTPSTEVSCEAASKDLQSNSSGLKALPLEGTSDGKAVLRSFDANFGRREPVIDMQQAKHPVEASYLSKASDSNAILTNTDSSNAKPSTQILHDQSSLLANPFGASVIPEQENIWQGGFEVLRTGGLPEFFDGIQAHLSTCASPNVLEVVSQFPCKLQLDEAPCFRLWPLQFQGISPKEDNIAIYFFAKDIESYERTYGKLLEDMLKNDLALRGNINEVEILIFPSNKLPENCQRWNMLFFLWGVFRGRTECSKILPDLQKQACQFKLSTDTLVQEFSSPLFEASTSRKINSHESSVKELSRNISHEGSDKELSRNNRSVNMEAMKSNIWVDLQPISSSGIKDEICNTKESSFVQNTSCQLASGSISLSCSSDSRGQLCSLLGTCPEPDLQMSTKDFCPALKGEAMYLEKSGSDIDGKAPVRIHATSIENLNSVLPTQAISSYFGQDGEGRGNGEKMRGKEGSMKHEASIDNELQEHLMEIDHLSWESRPSRKRAYSSSIDIVTRASGEPSKSTDEIILWSERANFISLEGEKRCKKMRSCSEIHANSSSRDENTTNNLSSKVHPLLSGYVNEQQHVHGFYSGTGMTENPRSAEKFFFPADSGPVRNVVSENLTHVLYSEDEGMPESSSPDLELALGGKKKSSEKEVLSLLFPLGDRQGSQEELPGPAVDDEDDMSAALSLSLAFPGTEKKQKDKTILRTEQLLPERPCVNTSLLLFGRFIGT